MFQRFWDDYLRLSKKDRLGAAVVLMLVSAIWLLPELFKKDASFDLEIPAPPPVVERAGIADEPGQAELRYATVGAAGPAGERFYFDPNTASAAEWQRMGLSAKATRTLLNYRNKGGRFRRPEDLQKIWSLPRGFYEQVAPFIRITTQPGTSPAAYTQRTAYDHPAYVRPEKTVVDINTADSAAWEALPGIGPRLSSRIVNFRNKLGGFHSVEQVAETWGLPDSTYQRIRPRLALGNAAIQKININTATIEDLRKHPYINWALAKAIVAYRQQHGLFTDLGQLANIMLLDEATLGRIKPYLSLE